MFKLKTTAKEPFNQEESDAFFQLFNGQFSDETAHLDVASVASGALNPQLLISQIVSAGAESRTLAAPSQDGQLKIIWMKTHGGDVTLAGTNISGHTAQTGTFTAVGSAIVLLSAGGLWLLVYSNITFA